MICLPYVTNGYLLYWWSILVTMLWLESCTLQQGAPQVAPSVKSTFRIGRWIRLCVVTFVGLIMRMPISLVCCHVVIRCVVANVALTGWPGTNLLVWWLIALASFATHICEFLCWPLLVIPCWSSCRIVSPPPPKVLTHFISLIRRIEQQIARFVSVRH